MTNSTQSSILVLDNIIQGTDVIWSSLQDHCGWKTNDVVQEDGYGNAKVLIDSKHRNSQGMKMQDDMPNWLKTKRQLQSIVEEYAKNNGIEINNQENYRIIKYKSGSGFFAEHLDSSYTMQRKISLILYLNTVTEGGETYFKAKDLFIKPSAGTVILFKSDDEENVHEGLKSMNEDKYIIVNWFN